MGKGLFVGAHTVRPRPFGSVQYFRAHTVRPYTLTTIVKENTTMKKASAILLVVSGAAAVAAGVLALISTCLERPEYY